MTESAKRDNSPSHTTVPVRLPRVNVPNTTPSKTITSTISSTATTKATMETTPHPKLGSGRWRIASASCPVQPGITQTSSDPTASNTTSARRFSPSQVRTRSVGVGAGSASVAAISTSGFRCEMRPITVPVAMAPSAALV